MKHFMQLLYLEAEPAEMVEFFFLREDNGFRQRNIRAKFRYP
jgi:hypothetical protein